MLWGDIKRIVRYNIFNDENEQLDNEHMFPDFANSALLRICSYDIPLIERYELTQFPIEPLTYEINTVQHTSADIIYQATKPVAYYFECDGNGTCIIEDLNGEQLVQVALSSNHKFVAYSGAIDTDTNVQLRFTGDYVYSIRNIALFPYIYSATDIPIFNRYNRYDMVELTKVNNVRTFLSFTDKAPVYKGKKLSIFEKFRIEQDTLLLAYDEQGEFTVFYKKYPAKITKNTPDDTDLGITDEACNLLASLLTYKMVLDDDKALATYYYNEYERLKEQHHVMPIVVGSGEYRHSKGWV